MSVLSIGCSQQDCLFQWNKPPQIDCWCCSVSRFGLQNEQRRSTWGLVLACWMAILLREEKQIMWCKPPWLQNPLVLCSIVQVHCSMPCPEKNSGWLKKHSCAVCGAPFFLRVPYRQTSYVYTNMFGIQISKWVSFKWKLFLQLRGDSHREVTWIWIQGFQGRICSIHRHKFECNSLWGSEIKSFLKGSKH